ncbi:MAG TPA: hypothetical protein PL044_11220 [Clostridiales bacterium]|nr:hypothetical protein [Clostridiales bacterium]HQH62810.1 hypothetical protein [Clostridiales bacterium]HQK74326.1 hypothetical protein [Clostridiales bacterium]
MAPRQKKPTRKPRRPEWLIPFFAVFLLLIVGANFADGYSYAWLFGSNTADNTFRTPLLTVNVDESNDGSTYGEWTPQSVAWGTSVDKYARFTNSGQASVVIRASYAQYWTLTEGTDVTRLNNYYDTGSGWANVATPDWNAGGFADTSLWTDGGDGWFYYRRVLAPGQSTPDVLEAVAFVTPAPAGYEDAEYSLVFAVEACQVSLNDPNENQQAVWLNFTKTYTVSGGTLTWSDSAP